MTDGGVSFRDLIRTVAAHDGLTDEERREVAAIDESVARDLDAALTVEATSAAVEEAEQRDIRARLNDMRLSEKIKVALFGNAVCRSILIFDPNRIIQECVLANPKLNNHEVEAFAKNSSVADFVLRTIAGRREFMRDYAIKLAIVSNPKSPSDVALKWLRFLNATDLKRLARSKNIPQMVALAARKALTEG